ncbi:MAG: VWA domain-containing protein [Desulfovibrio sp.]|jgi:Ca-activated chloride channel family protein|nr:VWA domain-containing protein [Desulfovibrio sp.]
MGSIKAFFFFGLFALIFGVPSLTNASPASPEGAAELHVKPLYSAAALAPGESTTVKMLITIEAPTVIHKAKRPPVAVSLVIDKSGSMEEARKMAYAKTAGRLLINNLGPDDLFSLTTYDNAVKVLAPLQPVKDKNRLLKLIDGIIPDGMTFLSGGLEKGVEQLKTVRHEGPSRVILLSDGLANVGVTQPEMVAAIGAKARNTGVGVTTIGLGLDFNEDLMQLLAQRGGGQYYYIKDSEYLPSVFAQELKLVADSFTRDLRVTFTRPSAISRAKVYGYSTTAKDMTLDIEMSDIASDEKRLIMLDLTITPDVASGKQTLGTVDFAYTDQDGALRQISLPVELDVLADAATRGQAEKQNEAATRQVREEALLLEVDEAHVEAIKELQKGNASRAKQILRAQQTALAAAPENKVAVNKLARIKQDEAQMDAAQHDPAMQNKIAKAGKASAYMSAKGQTQGIMLRKGDSGFMVERLQTALKQAGYYAPPINGVYGDDVENAVKDLQKAKSIIVDGIAGPATLQALGLD